MLLTLTMTASFLAACQPAASAHTETEKESEQGLVIQLAETEESETELPKPVRGVIHDNDGWWGTLDGEVDESSGILFVGDSRTVQLYHVCRDDGETEISVYDTLDREVGDLRFIARGGCDYVYSCAYSDEDYAWFRDDVKPRIEAFAQENPTGTILFNICFNDISYQADEGWVPSCNSESHYGAVEPAAYYEALAGDHPDMQIILMSLNPFDPYDEMLCAYNDYMKGLAERVGNMSYLDTYSYLKDRGESSVHYSYGVNRELFGYMMEHLFEE